MNLKDYEYHRTDLGVLYLADCLEIMPHLEPVDLVLTDPPYANNTEYLSYTDTKENLKTIVGKLFPTIIDIAKRTLITCGVGNIFLYPEPTWILSWVTLAGTGCSSWGFSCWQPILAYGKCPYLSSGKGRRPDTFQLTRTSDKNEHPCPKPFGIMMQLIQRASLYEGDSVLDPFLGSGTTAVACERLNRRWIGIEIEEKYCEIAAKRIEKERSQLKLFR